MPPAQPRMWCQSGQAEGVAHGVNLTFARPGHHPDCNGLTDGEIATSLKGNEERIKSCVADLLDALGLCTRMELISWFHSERARSAPRHEHEGVA